MAATASDDVAAAALMPGSVDLDFNIDDFDVRDLDFDFGDDLAADEFCDAYSAFVANADAKRVGGGGCVGTGAGWLAGLSLSGGGGGGGSEGSLEGSPDSVVTSDGNLAGEEAMSAVVAELERYLMEDDGDVEEEHICVDDFFGDLLLGSDFNGIVTAAAGGALHDGVEDNDDGDVLAAREDEPASRKRARHKIKGTTMTPWWGEPEMTRRHLARTQVLAPWPPAAAVILCCM